MAEFSVNPTRFDPYKNFKFRIKWDGRHVAGVSKISGLRRTTEVIQHREGGDPSTSRKSQVTPNLRRSRWSAVSRTIRSSRTGPTKCGVSVPGLARKFR
jgi:hypothetical protein